MNNPQLDQAREWAKEVCEEYFTYITDDSRAAIKVIQSLPDQWIDAEKVREIIVHLRADMDFNPDLEPHVEALESLLAPPLPTRPEDVPAGEPWIVEHDGHEWVGARDDSGTTNYPWVLAKIDGTDYVLSQDVEVTLVSRLVPEDKP